MFVDLHLHFVPEELERIVEEVKSAGLDAVCLVGDETLPSLDHAAAIAAAGVTVFRGVRVPLEKGGLVLFPPQADFDWDGFVAGLSEEADKTATARELGFAVVACHPYDKSAGEAMGDRIFQQQNIDALIVVTAASPQVANDLAMDALEALEISAAGGTGPGGAAGKAATLFVNSFDSQERLVEELRLGDFWGATVGKEDRFTTVERQEYRDDRRPRGGRRDDRRGDSRGGRGNFRDRGPDSRRPRDNRRGPRNR